jgi:hypothetical protein
LPASRATSPICSLSRRLPRSAAAFILRGALDEAGTALARSLDR